MLPWCGYEEVLKLITSVLNLPAVLALPLAPASGFVLMGSSFGEVFWLFFYRRCAEKWITCVTGRAVWYCTTSAFRRVFKLRAPCSLWTACEHPCVFLYLIPGSHGLAAFRAFPWNKKENAQRQCSLRSPFVLILVMAGEQDRAWCLGRSWAVVGLSPASPPSSLQGEGRLRLGWVRWAAGRLSFGLKEEKSNKLWAEHRLRTVAQVTLIMVLWCIKSHWIGDTYWVCSATWGVTISVTWWPCQEQMQLSAQCQAGVLALPISRQSMPVPALLPAGHRAGQGEGDVHGLLPPPAAEGRSRQVLKTLAILSRWLKTFIFNKSWCYESKLSWWYSWESLCHFLHWENLLRLERCVALQLYWFFCFGMSALVSFLPCDKLGHPRWRSLMAFSIFLIPGSCCLPRLCWLRPSDGAPCKVISEQLRCQRLCEAGLRGGDQEMPFW